jgi:hypothetical protein
MLNGWRMERFKLVGLLNPFLHKMRSGDLIPMAVFHVRRGDNLGSSSTRPVPVKVRATAPQYCGLKILRDGIRDPRLRRSLLFGSGIRRTRRPGSRRPFKRGAIRLQRHLPRVPLMVVFQTAKLRRGVQMLRATRPTADAARLSRFYNQFCLQSARSTTNAKRAGDPKLARL